VRVDLEEVRLGLLAHPKICRAAVKAWKPFEDNSLDTMDPGACVLVAYVELLSKEEATVDVASLFSWCKARLPEVSIPQRIVIMPTLPLLASSGKVDLQKLPLPSSKTKRQRLDIQSEASVFCIIAECLEHTNFEPSTNIFVAGASSIDAATIADALGIDIFAVYQNPSVRRLARHLARSNSEIEFERENAKVKSITQKNVLNFTSFIREKQYLYQKWKVSLSKCVDADPLLTSGHVYAKSHSGDIVCCRIEDGRVIWRKENICSDVGFAWCPMSTSSDIEMDPKPSDGKRHDSAVLVVVRNDGSLCFLNPLTGDESSRNNDLCGYSIRAVPAVDPWQHWVWVVTHGGGARRPTMMVIDPKSGRMIQSLSSLELPGPSSSKVAFASSANGSRYAHIACLDGSVLCTDASHDNSIIWNLKFDAPIFADPTTVVTSLNGGPPTTVVIILTVEGKVSFVKSGQVLWHLCLQGEGFYNNPIINKFTNKLEATFLLVFASRDGIITVVDELECAFSAVTKEIPQVRSFHAAMVVTRIASFASSFTNSSVILLLTECGHVGLVDLRDGGILDVCKLPASAYGLTVKGEHVGVGCRDDSCYLLQVSTSY
jgi:predicted DNA-binding ribbon-helix-helix protein